MKKAAEILVKCGYAHKSEGGRDEITGTEYYIYKKVSNKHQLFPVQLFSDTLEGRRQADAIEDWLIKTKHTQSWWGLSGDCNHTPRKTGKSWHEYRLDRIKWCLEQL